MTLIVADFLVISTHAGAQELSEETIQPIRSHLAQFRDEHRRIEMDLTEIEHYLEESVKWAQGYFFAATTNLEKRPTGEVKSWLEAIRRSEEKMTKGEIRVRLTRLANCDPVAQTNLAFVYSLRSPEYDGKTVYVCMWPIFVFGQNAAVTGQHILHEVIHLSGFEDECETAKIELATVIAAGYRPFHNDLVSQCRLSDAMFLKLAPSEYPLPLEDPPTPNRS